jgi:hypothetical protein
MWSVTDACLLSTLYVCEERLNRAAWDSLGSPLTYYCVMLLLPLFSITITRDLAAG